MAGYVLGDMQLKPIEIYGGKRALFITYAGIIADTIKDFGLKPLKEDIRNPAIKIAKAKAAAPAPLTAYVDPSIYGGKRFAHFHYKGDLYALTREQWQSFSARVKEDLIEKLHGANTINIEQIQDLSDIVDAIG